MRFSLAAFVAVAAVAFGDVVSAGYTNGTISVITVTSCVPTTYLSTVTVAPTSTSAPAAVGTGAAGVGSGAGAGASGTGSSYAGTATSTAISPAITPYTGAASNIAGSMAAVGFAAVAALVMA